MKKVIISLLTLFFTVSILAQPLPLKLKHTVIIDTDCGIDDMRAISLLLSRPEITIKAILSSDGSLSPGEGFEKICSLLYEFNRNNIPVACGDVIKGINPSWREFNRNVKWGSHTGGQSIFKSGINFSTLMII